MVPHANPTTLLNWVAALPLDVAFVLLVLPVMIIAALGTVLIRGLLGTQISPGSPVGATKAGAAAEIYAVVLGFIIVLGFTQFHDAKKDVLYETKLLERLANGSETDQRLDLSAQIETYARTVADKEWIMMAVGDKSAEAEAQMQALEDRVRSAAGSEDSLAGYRLLNLMDEIVELRTSRLSASPDPVVATIVFQVLLVGAGLAVVTGWFIRGPSVALHMFLSAVVAGSVVSLMILSAQVLYPFAGTVAISPEPFWALTDVSAR